MVIPPSTPTALYVVGKLLYCCEQLPMSYGALCLTILSTSSAGFHKMCERTKILFVSSLRFFTSLPYCLFDFFDWATETLQDIGRLGVSSYFTVRRPSELLCSKRVTSMQSIPPFLSLHFICKQGNMKPVSFIAVSRPVISHH
jgi:hypothetical protein